MTTVRLRQFPADSRGRFPIEIELDRAGQRSFVRATTAATLSDDDRKDLHWYLEEYLEQTFAPHPKRAARIEERMAALGEQLFRDLFDTDTDCIRLWAKLSDDLPDARFEIATDALQATAIPWELLRDPRSARPLALRAKAFVRIQSQSAATPLQPALSEGDRLRVLLVICRPDKDEDVPFRSVASRLMRAVNETGRERIDLTVLRPPRFDQLSKVLRAAKDAGRPYHIVHFDGHGTYVDVDDKKVAGGGGRYNPRWLGPARKGKHGYLAFENPDDPKNETLIGGPELGALLREAGVPVLVLNACRSAHAESDGAEPPPEEHQQQVRAFGSLAQEVMDAGVSGVLAMRYNVYVVTAAQYVGELYEQLAAGASLGEAATAARRHLHNKPARRIAGESVDLQDWVVPVLYEAMPVHLLRRTSGTAGPLFGGIQRASGVEQLPQTSELTFIGRDETLLALDRAFDRHRVVLLHGYAGAGKTSTAVEFARWYHDTGGLGDEGGLVLFESFEKVQTLPVLLEAIAAGFEQALQARGQDWLTLTKDQQPACVLSILRQVPILWIWDNVEPVAGFPAGTPSRWTTDEQAELRDFLAAVAAQGGRGRILLTSRRDERGWLGDIPARIEPPPMPMAERLALAEELAQRQGHGVGFSWTLLPLLDYSQGNPMTLIVLVGQALRDKLTTSEAVERYVARLRAGESAFEDDRAQGRTRSLGASLAYGFEKAFTEEERRLLALLHLFQGVVDANTLVAMGRPGNPSALPPYQDFSRTAWLRLLERAAEIGLLARLRIGQFRIHPALPWFFKALFDSTWSSGDETERIPLRAYAEAEAFCASQYQQIFHNGQHVALQLLYEEEANLLNTVNLSLKHSWPSVAIGALQGLRILYTTKGRWTAWARLVADTKTLFQDADTGDPAPGQEENWVIWQEYQISFAERSHDLGLQLQIVEKLINWGRQRIGPATPASLAELNDDERHAFRSLSVFLQRLGRLQMECDSTEALDHLKEAHELSQQLGEKTGQAITAFNLASAYFSISAVRDLDLAEHWYRTSLSLCTDNPAGVAKNCCQLGQIAIERFDALADVPNAERRQLISYLQEAEQHYQNAIAIMSDVFLKDLATAHLMLGGIYQRASLLDPASKNLRQSIHYAELDGDRFTAGKSRINLSSLYLTFGNFRLAREYAVSALADFRSYGSNANDMIANAERLLTEIDEASSKPESTEGTEEDQKPS